MRNRYSAHRNVQTANFICGASLARSVSVVGDFNQWNEASHPMQRTPAGTWILSLQLRHGHHRYAFMVDGTLTLDPVAMGITKDDRDRRVSLIALS